MSQSVKEIAVLLFAGLAAVLVATAISFSLAKPVRKEEVNTDLSPMNDDELGIGA